MCRFILHRSRKLRERIFLNLNFLNNVRPEFLLPNPYHALQIMG